jgi:hypothetical protein
MASKSLQRVADLRQCTYDEAQEFCDQVRALCHQAPSTTSILGAATQLEYLEEPYTLQEVANLAMQLHQQELAKRPSQRLRRRGRLRPPPRREPRFIIDEYGTVRLNNPKNRDVFED